MALVAGDTVFLIIRQEPGFPLQWWPVAAFSNQTDADAYLANNIETKHRVVHMKVTS